MDPFDYLDGERAAGVVLAHIQNGTAHPDELAAAISRLESGYALTGFCRTVQKFVERTSRAAAA